MASGEAYSQSDGLTYQESDSYRTTDCTRNMVRVGEEMAQVFRANGLEVIHDTNLYDYPAYNGAYDRSGRGGEGLAGQVPLHQNHSGCPPGCPGGKRRLHL
ncbi:MAG: stage II sporulation protein P [Flavonifractor plautii]